MLTHADNKGSAFLAFKIVAIWSVPEIARMDVSYAPAGMR